MSLEDKDLLSVQQARTMAARARDAQRKGLAAFSQEKVDAIVDAMAEAARGDAERLARMAHDETGFGNVKDKTTKNLFAAVDVHRYIRPLRTVGILREDPATRVVEIAEPMGVVAAIIPSTNPTSTAIYKALISIKARNACVMSPHPSARQCILEAVRVMHGPAVKAGLPEDALACMTEVSLEGTQELMRSRDTGVILATGGIGLVRAAYSSGRPAYGVGPGNVPAYVHSSADVPAAVAHIVAGKTFDYGTLCSSEQSLVCDEAIHEAVLHELGRNGACLLDDAGAAAVARVVVTPQRLANPEVVGKPATYIAEKAGLKVPPETRVLVARLSGVGRDHPLSIEKLSPVLALYVVKDWQEGSERVLQLLRYRGTGHSMAIHSRDDGVIREFALRNPVFRVIANTQASMGATGYTTGLAPSMSLGCGAYAGNITSDNITPLHLINIKRLAYPVSRSAQTAPEPPKPIPLAGPPPPPPVDFVCEDDVRRAIRDGRTIVVSHHAIITPSARDAAEGRDIIRIIND